MFLHELTEPQRQACLTLAARLASVDDPPNDQELAILTQMREEMDLPLSWRPSWEPTAELLVWFEGERVRALLVMELMRVARVDRSITEPELGFLRELTQVLGLSGARVRQLVAWLARYESLMDEGNRLLGP